jgi:hypothetical protein
MNDFLDFFSVVICSILLASLVLTIVAIPIVFLSNLVKEQNCYSMYKDYQPTYGFWEGCRIMWDGKMTPVSMIKNININK